ncbi:MAG: AAA family ATPase [Gemmatimonadaceae bacterium]
MLHIRTLGASVIAVGNEHVGVEQPMVFALLFMLAMRHRGSASRRELAALLWPGAADAERNHRLRSLLHRVRRIGAPLLCSATTVTLEESTVDFREYSTPPASTADVRGKLSFLAPVLPELSALPTALSDHLEQERDVIVATTTRWLLAAITLSKAAGDWSLASDAARRARDIDPNNEVAVETLAEHACLTAQGATGEVPLIGRDDIMHRIGFAAARAVGGEGGALLLWGPAGIGKTRVLSEVARRRRAMRARVISIAARLEWAHRPLALILHLTRRLLDERGAAGCDPGAYRWLRGWVEREAPNDAAEGDLYECFVELLAALADEYPIVLSIDDTHLVDRSTWRFLRAAMRWSVDRRILWLLSYRARGQVDLAALPEGSILPRLELRPFAPYPIASSPMSAAMIAF